MPSSSATFAATRSSSPVPSEISDRLPRIGFHDVRDKNISPVFAVDRQMYGCARLVRLRRGKAEIRHELVISGSDPSSVDQSGHSPPGMLLFIADVCLRGLIRVFSRRDVRPGGFDALAYRVGRRVLR